MDLTEIRKIVKLMNEHELSYFHLEQEGVNLKLKKGVDLDALKGLALSAPAPAAAPAPVAAAPAAGDAPAEAAAPVGEEINAPMVGTFYRKPSPDADLFVNVGDRISEGQTICIIEAMKVMNEIKAEKSGEITEILVEDGTPVQYGDALFRIK
ncbi:acetyl-CoA carboxylase biotin carboxyl carrier protein [Persicirhabdus sediminis]|uniref:Biotin carboxyl carrier protein of acetyl-CoA carboxylase n=1 Tax=Persicirhabdus sediminis TaxID=454144 RepID=A0A8J7SJD6_9BACT|nr:acetyl-CoA carboxylase biotin carboxyl carrier protein [Persicirhabdus sediminis]MBK1792075.1 acetyl-CoA carboxylase biotin carboxyl carrier protein [Persicirhabdus sediminis]